MLKIRYLKDTGLLTDWEDDPSHFEDLQARAGVAEDVATLDIPKPEADDYEYYIFSDGNLTPSGKEPPPESEPERDLATEIDEMKAELKQAGIM
ncbi:hypothetical protein ES703_27412 [subsurface metagenome]